MRALWLTGHRGLRSFEVRETPDPVPGPGQALVRMRASGLNFSDLLASQGLYPDAPRPPCVLGYEIAGSVEAVGEDVDPSLVGRRILAATKFGGHAELVALSATQIVPLPDSMSFAEAAALPVNYLTAYHILHRIACLRDGESVLIHQAAGGVGIALLQLCSDVPGVVTFGTASASKHEILRANGCTHPIDYRTSDYAAEIRRLTGGAGVDVVIDALGGADWRKGYALLKSCGRLVCFGFANMLTGGKRSLWNVLRQLRSVPRFNPLSLMSDNRSVAGVNLGHLSGEELLPQEMAAVLRLYERGVVKPRVDATVPLVDAVEGLRRLQDGKNVGKVVLVP